MTLILNDTAVPRDAHNHWKGVRAGGGKIHLMKPEEHEIENPSLCLNCGGIGEVIFETITGGPQDTPIPVAADSGDTTTSIDEKWYKRRLRLFVCPVCNQTGKRPVDAD